MTSVECICFDEADRLFEMGFIKQIDEVLAACTNPKVQRCMFSATMPQGVEDMAESILRKPNRIVIGNKNTGNTSINQQLCFVGKEEGKLVALKQLIQQVRRRYYFSVLIPNRDLNLQHCYLCKIKNVRKNCAMNLNTMESTSILFMRTKAKKRLVHFFEINKQLYKKIVA